MHRSEVVSGGVTSVGFSTSGRLLFAGYVTRVYQIWAAPFTMTTLTCR